jgi:hypothetical protein
VGRGADGGVIVLPLEDPEGVDARRRQWGMQPLVDYVRLYGAPAVKISQECADLALFSSR